MVLPKKNVISCSQCPTHRFWLSRTFIERHHWIQILEIPECWNRSYHYENMARPKSLEGNQTQGLSLKPSSNWKWPEYSPAINPARNYSISPLCVFSDLWNYIYFRTMVPVTLVAFFFGFSHSGVSLDTIAQTVVGLRKAIPTIFKIHLVH